MSQTFIEISHRKPTAPLWTKIPSKYYKILLNQYFNRFCKFSVSIFLSFPFQYQLLIVEMTRTLFIVWQAQYQPTFWLLTNNNYFSPSFAHGLNLKIQTFSDWNLINPNWQWFVAVCDCDLTNSIVSLHSVPYLIKMKITQ